MCNLTIISPYTPDALPRFSGLEPLISKPLKAINGDGPQFFHNVSYVGNPDHMLHMVIKLTQEAKPGLHINLGSSSGRSKGFFMAKLAKAHDPRRELGTLLFSHKRLTVFSDNPYSPILLESTKGPPLSPQLQTLLMRHNMLFWGDVAVKSEGDLRAELGDTAAEQVLQVLTHHHHLPYNLPKELWQPWRPKS